MVFIERKGDVTEVPETISPLTIERKEVVTPVPSQFKQGVSDVGGQIFQSTPPQTPVNIQIPKDPATLASLSKGDTQNAITWFAAFWLRMIKKAIYFGWKVINKQ